MRRPSAERLEVTVAGFPLCAGRFLSFSLIRESGESVFDDPNLTPTGMAAIADDGSATAGFEVAGIPAGRYVVWVRSVCTGTIANPNVIALGLSLMPPDVGSGKAVKHDWRGPAVAGVGALLVWLGATGLVVRTRARA